MRLEVDLRFESVPVWGTAPGEARHLDLNTIVHAARSPRRLWRLMRDRRYAEVHVREGVLPASAVQAACMIAVAAVPARTFVVDGRCLGRLPYLGRAVAKAAVAVPSELARSVELAHRVTRAARRPTALPRHATAVGRALYLRADPTLNWMGLQVGGAATHMRGVINGLLDNDVRVDVVAAERPLGTERARFIRAPVRRVLQLVPSLAFTEYSRELVRAASGLSADFVYQRHRLGANAGLEIASRLGVPLVLEFNGSDIWVERNWVGARMPLAGRLESLEHRNLLDASLVVVVSEALREVVVAEGVPPDRVLVNPNGVDIDELEPYRTGTSSTWRARAGLPDAPTVGFIGTFGPWHGARLLPALAAAVPEARWVIVGDGPLFPEVHAEMTARGLDDRVLMTGLVERARALELLASCDVFVSPHVPNPDGSRFFGSPTKVFEYMGLHRPIVAADLGQLGEILDHERTALLFEPGDVTAAAAQVSRLLDDGELRERLAAAAFELAAAEYTWNAHVRRILAALEGAPPGSS
jgi:glycosyltransferase involved in cell wall biosynthesis